MTLRACSLQGVGRPNFQPNQTSSFNYDYGLNQLD
jgi:hypothetical protein